jgi:hypothetical protein
MNHNETNTALIRLPFELFTSAGVPITGASFTNPPATGEVQISKAGATYADVAGSVVEIGSGSYYYQGVTADANTRPWVNLKVNKSGAVLVKYNEPVTPNPDAIWDALGSAHNTSLTMGAILQALTGGGGGPSAASIAAAVMASILRDGGANPDSTVLGHLRRMDALFFGQVSGMLGALVTAMQPGGVTPEFAVAQDTVAGSRSEVDRTTSETP